MILILSENNDFTTNEVIKWLHLYEKNYIRVHEYELFEIKVIDKRILLKSERNSFYIDDIKSVWFRRGGIKFNRIQFQNLAVNTIMNETQFWLEDYVIKTLESKKHINKQSNNRTNKLLVLEKAIDVGLNVPTYFLAENTDDVIVDKTITKSISENIVVQSAFKEFDGILYTSVVSMKENEAFFPTFFQEKIEKHFEIRCFYLNGRIWSCAIFSQNDEQTKIDSRIYNFEKPNRNVRYTLPLEVQEKVCSLMDKLDYNCGSIDFIKSIDGKYYFLEVNPVGQFLGVSSSCNYSLEKEIADYL
jgi:ATP-GRASP peptide maturase of grasp-with-spasm system